MRVVENAGTPLYAAAFAKDDTFVVGGGGGQGAHGVSNKLVAYSLVPGKLDRIAELDLPQNSDSPTSMAADTTENSIWVGANFPHPSGEVNHLTRVKVADGEKLELGTSYNHFKANDIAVYQRTTSVAGNMVASTSSSDPGVVTVFNYADGNLVIMKFKEELVGAAIADYDEKAHKFVAAASESQIDVRLVSKPDASFAQLAAPRGERWSRITAVGPGKFVATSTIGSRQGAKLTVFETGFVEESREPYIRECITTIPGFKSVTALSSAGSRVALASPGGDVILYDVSGFENKSPKLVARLKGVHKFPVTALAVSPDGSSVVSTSLDGSLVVHTDLDSYKGSLKATIGWVTLSAILIAILALAVSYNIQYNHQPDVSHHYQPPSGVLEIPLHRGPGGGHGPVVHPYIERSQHKEYVHSNEEHEESAVAGTAPEPTPETPEAEAVTQDASQTPEPEKGESAERTPEPAAEEEVIQEQLETPPPPHVDL